MSNRNADISGLINPVDRPTSATACACPCGACSGRVYGNREHSACRFGCVDPRPSEAKTEPPWSQAIVKVARDAARLWEGSDSEALDRCMAVLVATVKCAESDETRTDYPIHRDTLRGFANEVLHTPAARVLHGLARRIVDAFDALDVAEKPNTGPLGNACRKCLATTGLELDVGARPVCQDRAGCAERVASRKRSDGQ